MPLFEPHSELQHLYMAKVMQRVVAQKDAVLCREGQVGGSEVQRRVHPRLPLDVCSPRQVTGESTVHTDDNGPPISVQVGNVSLCVLSGCVMQHFNSSVAQAIKHAAGRTLEDMITRGSFMALMKAKLAGDEPLVEEPSDSAYDA